jgi:hypothetical protein
MFRRKDRNRNSDKKRKMAQEKIIVPTEINLNNSLPSGINLNSVASATVIEQTHGGNQEKLIPASNQENKNQTNTTPAAQIHPSLGTPVAYSLPPDTLQEIKKANRFKIYNRPEWLTCDAFSCVGKC